MLKRLRTTSISLWKKIGLQVEYRGRPGRRETNRIVTIDKKPAKIDGLRTRSETTQLKTLNVKESKFDTNPYDN